jgi:hypothetical protein
MLDTRRSMNWTTLVCILLLLVATSLQAAHTCGIATNPAAKETVSNNSDSLPATNSVCLSCITAHSTAPVASLNVVSPAVDNTQTVSIVEVHAKSSLEVFALYVRPPPSV